MTSKQYQDLRKFLPLVRDVIRSEEFRKMKTYRHHRNGNLFDHSVKVAFLCYRHHRKFHMKSDVQSLVRGALLHDYYLYDLHGDGKPHKKHWFRHPDTALRNALAQYPLTERQKDMIKHHMFPITVIPPKTPEGWLVCLYDKIAAVSDRFGTSGPL